MIERSKTNFFVIIRKHLKYRERNEFIIKCFHSKQIKFAFKFLHEIHKHFSSNITMQKTMKRFY